MASSCVIKLALVFIIHHISGADFSPTVKSSLQGDIIIGRPAPSFDPSWKFGAHKVVTIDSDGLARGTMILNRNQSGLSFSLGSKLFTHGKAEKWPRARFILSGELVSGGDSKITNLTNKMSSSPNIGDGSIADTLASKNESASWEMSMPHDVNSDEEFSSHESPKKLATESPIGGNLMRPYKQQVRMVTERDVTQVSPESIGHEDRVREPAIEDVYCNRTTLVALVVLPQSFVIGPDFNDLKKADDEHGLDEVESRTISGQLCSITPVNYRLDPTYRVVAKDFHRCGVTIVKEQFPDARELGGSRDRRVRGRELKRRRRRSGHETGPQRVSHSIRSTIEATSALEDSSAEGKYLDRYGHGRSVELLLLNLRFPVIKSLRTDEDTYATIVCAPDYNNANKNIYGLVDEQGAGFVERDGGEKVTDNDNGWELATMAARLTPVIERKRDKMRGETQTEEPIRKAGGDTEATSTDALPSTGERSGFAAHRVDQSEGANEPGGRSLVTGSAHDLSGDPQTASTELAKNLKSPDQDEGDLGASKSMRLADKEALLLDSSASDIVIEPSVENHRPQIKNERGSHNIVRTIATDSRNGVQANPTKNYQTESSGCDRVRAVDEALSLGSRLSHIATGMSERKPPEQSDRGGARMTASNDELRAESDRTEASPGQAPCSSRQREAKGRATLETFDGSVAALAAVAHANESTSMRPLITTMTKMKTTTATTTTTTPMTPTTMSPGPATIITTTIVAAPSVNSSDKAAVTAALNDDRRHVTSGAADLSMSQRALVTCAPLCASPSSSWSLQSTMTNVTSSVMHMLKERRHSSIISGDIGWNGTNKSIGADKRYATWFHKAGLAASSTELRSTGESDEAAKPYGQHYKNRTDRLASDVDSRAKSRERADDRRFVVDELAKASKSNILNKVLSRHKGLLSVTSKDKNYSDSGVDGRGAHNQNELGLFLLSAGCSILILVSIFAILIERNLIGM